MLNLNEGQARANAERAWTATAIRVLVPAFGNFGMRVPGPPGNRGQREGLPITTRWQRPMALPVIAVRVNISKIKFWKYT